MEFSGKVALITGAGSGMGACFSRRFGAEGAAVLCCDINLETAESTAAEIRAGGGQAAACPCDVTRPAAIEAAVAEAVHRFGRLDITVANAGTTLDQPFLDLTEANWDFIMDLNCKGVFFTYQAAARQMVAQGSGGRLITIASVAGHRGRPIAASYAASKAAIISLTKTAALAFAPHRITANSVSPGLVVTRLWERVDRERQAAMGWPPGTAFEEVRSRTPLGRGCSPDEVAEAVLFLASDRAAFITGEDILIDGGMLAR